MFQPSRLAALACTFLVASFAAAQLPAAQLPNAAPSNATVLHTGTQLVVVDVSVADKSGKPVHGLQQSDFELTENSSPESIKHFEEHTRSAAQPNPSLPPLPPGTYTNYSPVPPNAPLNVLLIDHLNTPQMDQIYLRRKLLEYLKHANPADRIAVFGVGAHLYLLQGFTSNPDTLIKVIEAASNPKSSPLLNSATGSGLVSSPLSDQLASLQIPEAAEMVANLQAFETDEAAFQAIMRGQYTYDAFDQLAKYLAAFPGRKNVLWFSGSFPLILAPDPTSTNKKGFNALQTSDQDFRITTNELTRAQIAVYPIDARGLATLPTADITLGNLELNGIQAAQKFEDITRQDTNTRADEQGTYDAFARETGGKAFYNTNDLTGSIAKSIDAGSNYYTLLYSPSNHNWDGGYRRIGVKLTAAASEKGLHLVYRRGYFGIDPAQQHTASLSQKAASEKNSPRGYANASMSHGSPEPVDIVFKARVLPVNGQDETLLAADNHPAPQGKLKPPYRRYGIDYVMRPSDIALTSKPDGTHAGAIEFTTYVYDESGILLNSVGTTLRLQLDPATYRKFISQPIQYHFEVSAPAKQNSFLRVAVHDPVPNHFGVVEIPTSALQSLPPAIASR